VATPELWIIAGPNGAGKTTFVQRQPVARLLPGVRFLNPDDLAHQRLVAEGWRGFTDAPLARQRTAFLDAAQEVVRQLDVALSDREAVGVETVLSTEKYQPVAARGTNGRVSIVTSALPAWLRTPLAALNP